MTDYLLRLIGRSRSATPLLVLQYRQYLVLRGVAKPSGPATSTSTSTVTARSGDATRDARITRGASLCPSREFLILIQVLYRHTSTNPPTTNRPLHRFAIAGSHQCGYETLTNNHHHPQTESKCVDAVIRRSAFARRKRKGAVHRASPRLNESTNIYISIGACVVVGIDESRLYVRRNHTKCNVNFVNSSRVVIADQGRSSPPN